MGGVNGSTMASTITGSGVASARSRILPQSVGSSIAMPMPPTGFCKSHEINGVQFAAEFRIAEKHHLLPLDHAQSVILYDDELDGELVFYGSREFRHQHRETSDADERNALPIWVCDLSGYRIGQSVGHSGQGSRQ